MKLTLVNFRRFKNLELEFSNGKTLLSGQSGAGKTTILNAIAWVLYGGMKHVSHPESSKTSVRLEMDDVVIIRSKSPKTLCITVGEQTYTTESISQPKIDELFGSPAVKSGPGTQERGHIMYASPF